MNAPAYRIDGRPADAEAFYAVACDPRRSVVVEACAGAGKTWMLVSRIVRALLAGAEPQQVLAITFTRKAAGEMRERLEQWLADFAAPSLGDAARAAELRLRGVPAAQAQALAPALGRLHERVLAAARAVEVRTFHGWFAQWVLHAPMGLLDALGLPAAPELLEDTAPLQPLLMRRFHRAVDRDAALRADYLALVRRHRRSTVLGWLEAAWQRGTEVEAADRAGTLEPSVPPAAALWPDCAGLDDPLALLAALAPSLSELSRQFGAGATATQQGAGAGLAEAVALGATAAGFERAWATLFTQAGQPRKRLGDSELQAQVCERLLGLRERRAQHEAWDDHRRLVRLARRLLAEYARLKHEHGWADMADLERAALAMLSDPVVAGWVQERLDQRVHHLLIDEFQDTSPLQWHALHAWLSSYAGAGVAPSVFIVGDPKQSIYRFRRAEPRVFEAARAFVADALGGQVLECDHTRRNAPEVVQAMNAVFSAARDSGGWGPFRPHSTASTAPGRVQALPGVVRPARTAAATVAEVWRDSLLVPRREPETVLRAQEAALVAGAVAELVGSAGVAPGEIMVLARRRDPLLQVADALAVRHLPHVMPQELALAETPEALDLTALLDALASPGHDLSLARALKSPVFGVDDDGLRRLSARARQCRQPWSTALQSADVADHAALVRAQALLAGWQAAAAHLSPHDLIDRIVAEGDLEARFGAAVPPWRRGVAVQALGAVVAAALDHDGGRYASLYGFVRALKSGHLRGAAQAPADAVQLLTIHGAKGLEARAVFVVDADPEPRPAERATLLVDWPAERPAPSSVAFLRSEGDPPASLRPLLAAEVAAREREELNALYVAMTRARERLVFSHTEPRTRAATGWWLRVQAGTTGWVPQPPAGHAADPPAVVARLPVLQVSPVAPGAAAGRGAPRDPEAARLGQAVHRALEWLGQPGRRVEPARAAAAAAAAFGAATDAVLPIVERVLGQPQAARFFAGPALRWAGNEVPMADDQGLMRLDRLVLLDGPGGPGWWVLDYKLGARPDELAEYRAQMARYIAAVTAAQPGATVRGGFLTGRGDFIAADVN